MSRAEGELIVRMLLAAFVTLWLTGLLHRLHREGQWSFRGLWRQVTREGLW